MNTQLKPGLCTLSAVAAILLCAVTPAHAQYAGPPVASPPPAASAPASAMNVPVNNLAILPGDVIAIATYGVPELTTSGTGPLAGLKVDPQGDIVLPYLGTVKVAGMTPAELTVYLERQLKDQGILVDPQMSVELMSSPTQMVTVVGEVLKPQPVPTMGVDLRLLDVISACGGFTPLASHVITVDRPGVAQPITVNLGVDPDKTGPANIPLLPGDTVLVPKVGNAYVVGQVLHPAAVPLANNAPITVVQAISITGGLKYGAALSKAMIIRSEPNHEHVEIVFDLKKVLAGKERDIALDSNDILYIPTNGFKAALSTGGAAQSAVYAAIGLGYIIQ
jgi:polysaccharide biosynthesis/export protein